VTRGRQIYADQKCSMCHQIAGHGNKMFPLDGVGGRLSEADLRRWFTHTAEMENARPKRPAIRMSSRNYDFSDADLDALVAYLKTLR
jgi:mono/diheme cytochrome c family protein